jgi:hypothetical protein
MLHLEKIAVQKIGSRTGLRVWVKRKVGAPSVRELLTGEILAAA